MGGRGSGGRRVGSGKKRKSDLEHAITGTSGPRGIVAPRSSGTAIVPGTAIAPVVETFDPPADLLVSPAQLAAITAELAILKRAGDRDDPQIDVLQVRVDEMNGRAQALAVWHELAPHAGAARTLTPATTAAFVMLCRGVATERALSMSAPGGPDHRGMLQRVATWMKDFSLAPLGKAMYAAEAQAPANPLDRFTAPRLRMAKADLK